ncbi:MAG: alpha-ketoacid dehydrogenase subunit beta [Deltaproteobacteria bacterium]|nr:alpha-ketoacid dehydrogenase subunit beta [Deltaproteobacteria bacterium]
MTRELFYADAIREALLQEMQRDENVYCFGEDIGDYGGVFGVTMGLIKEVRPMQVRSTPLSEAAILGEAVGAAIYGLRPVPEIQFGDFISVAMSQVVDLMASYHYRVGTALPLTIRIPSGGMLHIGNFHSNCWENWFTHVPGLKVVVPSCAYDAKGLLVSAIRDNNPVLFFEQKRMYRVIKDEVPEELYEVPFGQVRDVCDGDDLTIFSYGNMIPLAEEAARELEKKKISAAIVDVRSLLPLDKDGIIERFRRTKRAIVLHEARTFSGFGGEIASLLQEEAFDDMAAPIIRIGSIHTPVPMSPNLEKAYLPSLNQVLEAADKLMRY